MLRKHKPVLQQRKCMIKSKTLDREGQQQLKNVITSTITRTKNAMQRDFLKQKELMLTRKIKKVSKSLRRILTPAQKQKLGRLLRMKSSHIGDEEDSPDNGDNQLNKEMQDFFSFTMGDYINNFRE